MTTDTPTRQKALYEVSRKINSNLNLPQLLNEIMDLAIDLLGADKGLVLVMKSEFPDLSIEVARAKAGTTIANPVEMSRSIARVVAAEGRSVLIRVPDMPTEERSESLYRFDINSVICVPLRSSELSVGSIYLDTTERSRYFQDEDVTFLEAFANLSAIAIENARRFEEIRRLNSTLEDSVEQRTAELVQKNAELTDAYRELKSAQIQLLRSEKMASLGLLVAGIAHEINNPLGSIKSSSDLIMRGAKRLEHEFSEVAANRGKVLDAEAIKVLGILNEASRVNATACDRIAHTVKVLRSFAKLDEQESRTTDIHEGLENTLALMRHQYVGRIEIVREYGSIRPLLCKAGQLNQVFMNLLLNACEAIKGSGTIVIRTSANAGRIRIEISDTGSGIARDRLDRIFDPGFTTKGVGVGTGLGLAISYRIIEDHGGSIEVESTSNEGTTMSINLPYR